MTFGMLLKIFITEKGYTIYGFAKKAGINRTTLQKIITNERYPSKDFIVKIIDTLIFSDEEVKQIENEYYSMKFGKTYDNYRQFKILSKIELCNNEQNIVNFKYDHKLIIKNHAMNSKNSILSCLKSILESEINKDILIISQNITEITLILQTINTQAFVKQIICLPSKDCELFNRFSNIVSPLTLFSKLINYHINYYYDSVSSHFNEYSILPCLLITGNYVLNFSNDLQRALLFDDCNIINFYKEIFNDIWTKTRPYISRLNQNILDYIAYLENLPSYQGIIAYLYDIDIIERLSQNSANICYANAEVAGNIIKENVKIIADNSMGSLNVLVSKKELVFCFKNKKGHYSSFLINDPVMQDDIKCAIEDFPLFLGV